MNASAAVATLTLAFAADPFLRWIYPESCEYLAHFPELMLAFGGAAFDQETVWQLGGHAAVAMWMPPGIEPDGDATVAMFEASVGGDRIGDLLTVFDQMDDTRSELPVVVPAVARSRLRSSGSRTGIRAAETMPGDRGQPSPAGLSRFDEPAKRSVLRTTRLQGHRPLASWLFTADHLHAASSQIAGNATAVPSRPMPGQSDSLWGLPCPLPWPGLLFLWVSSSGGGAVVVVVGGGRSASWPLTTSAACRIRAAAAWLS